ncbi:MAG: hypothetical protein M0R03_22490 [Novosphingobium sp.]|jgi:hypothetical protein|nr:hypothetical protein [Novosphingobium sp.]
MARLAKEEIIYRITSFMNEGLGGIMIDSEWTNVYSVKEVHINSKGIWLKGIDCHCKKITDKVEEPELRKIYREMFKQDEDFRNFINNKFAI